MQILPVIVLGLTSLLMQVAVMRQFLAVFSGNELVIGVTLSAWLLAVGTGSLIGHRLALKDAFGFSFIGVALLVQPAMFLISMIRPLFGIQFGEVIPLSTTLISTVLAIFPLCLVIGVQFPLAVSYSGGKSGKAYGLEAIGAFIGGVLFTVVLSGRLNMSWLTLAISILNVLTGLLLLKRRSIGLLFLVPLILHIGISSMAIGMKMKGAEVIEKLESRYGEIVVLRTGQQDNLYSSGKLFFSYPDPQTEELRVHLPMSLHPAPQRVLMVGGSPVTVRELLKYPLSNIDFIEIDPVLIDVSMRLLSAADRDMIRDRRARIMAEDARRFLKRVQNAWYDVVILNLPEPSTANINRFYTMDFFKEVKGVLREKGLFCLTLPGAFGYIGRNMQTANGSVYSSLRYVFSHSGLSSEEYGYVFGSESPVDTDPSHLTARFEGRQVDTAYFRPYIIDDAFDPVKVMKVKERLEMIGTLNSDMRPVSYLYNLMLWSEVHGGRLPAVLFAFSGMGLALSLAVLFLLLSIMMWRSGKIVFFSTFTTGYSTMALCLIVILTYQAFYGYVYEMIGLLTATFMVGVAAGSMMMQGGIRPLNHLRLLELAAMGLFIAAPLFLEGEALFYLLSFLCGVAGGTQFATANLCVEGDKAKVAGRLYASDLAGSFLGAFVTAIIMLPLAGVHNTLAFLVLIKGISFISLSLNKT